MKRGVLRSCPKCLQAWPRKADHDLRGFGWLHDLPRNVSLSNADALLHDGAHGRDRFLMFEVKMPWEPELQAGQGWLLRALAAQSNWTVRLLHSRKGEHGTVRVHTVSGDRVEPSVLKASLVDLRSSVVDWLNGDRWNDPKGKTSEAFGTHHHGYAREGGQWRCVQDYYAAGNRPETGCGDVWTQPEGVG